MAIVVSSDEIKTISPKNSESGNGSGTPDVVSGLAGSTDGAPEASSSPKPPYTNQGGVNDTIPPENRSLFDWLSLTVKSNDPSEILNIIGLHPSLFTELPMGFSGYRKSLQFGNIRVFFDGRKDMGCCLDMSGQGCRQYEAHFSDNPWLELVHRATAANANFTRLDLAIDNVDGALTLDRIWTAIEDHENQVRTRFSEWQRILKGSFLEGQRVTGETIYLGSKKSHTLCRVYNKAQQLDLVGHWIRFELRLRDKRAQEAIKHFVSGVSVGALATGIINNYFSVINNDDSNKSRCTLQSWWAQWLDSTEKIRLSTAKEEKFVSDTMDFIKRQYAPSLAMINKHLGGETFKEFVKEVLADGNERMSARHEQMLAASAAGSRRKGGTNGLER